MVCFTLCQLLRSVLVFRAGSRCVLAANEYVYSNYNLSYIYCKSLNILEQFGIKISLGKQDVITFKALSMPSVGLVIMYIMGLQPDETGLR